MSTVNKRNSSATQVVTANRLGDGVVIYLQMHGSRHHWCENIREASVFDAKDIEAMLVLATIDVAENKIVDPYAIGVNRDHIPMTQREAVRACGPTIAYGA